MSSVCPVIKPAIAKTRALIGSRQGSCEAWLVTSDRPSPLLLLLRSAVQPLSSALPSKAERADRICEHRDKEREHGDAEPFASAVSMLYRAVPFASTSISPLLLANLHLISSDSSMASLRIFAARTTQPLLRTSRLASLLATSPIALSTRTFAAAAFTMTGKKNLLDEIKVCSCHSDYLISAFH